MMVVMLIIMSDGDVNGDSDDADADDVDADDDNDDGDAHDEGGGRASIISSQRLAERGLSTG